MKMNWILKSTDRYYLLSIVGKDQGFRVKSVVAMADGTISHSDVETVETYKEATQKVKKRIRIKKKRRGYEDCDFDKTPIHVLRLLDLDEPKKPIEVLIGMLKEARIQRYVIFSDIGGMEDFFDADVQYLAEIIPEDDTMYNVFDRSGKKRRCSVSRLEGIEFTEEGKELQEKGIM